MDERLSVPAEIGAPSDDAPEFDIENAPEAVIAAVVVKPLALSVMSFADTGASIVISLELVIDRLPLVDNALDTVNVDEEIEMAVPDTEAAIVVAPDDVMLTAPAELTGAFRLVVTDDIETDDAVMSAPTVRSPVT